MRFYGIKFHCRKRILQVFGLILLIFSGGYLSSVVYIIFDIIGITTRGEIDTEGFIPPDLDQMEEMAGQFEFYLKENHLPMNYTLSVIWNENFTSIDRYIVQGDACIWTGLTLGTESYRYALALRTNNETEQLEALNMVKRILSGVALLLAVPNGGIGPMFSGILARSVYSPDYSGPPISGFYPSYNPKDVFNGSGPYQDWLWMGYPSVDQNSGIVFGLTQTAVFVSPHDFWVANLTSLLTQQLTEHFLTTNWLLVDKDGRTTGQDLKISYEESAFALLSMLQMAKLANPSSYRYAQFYFHFAYERDYASALKPHFPMVYFNYVNYYTTNLYLNYFYSLAAFESDPYLKTKYIEVIEESFYPAFRVSRNAWFNIVYLGITRKNNTIIAQDIGDQLMRYGISYGPENRTRIPDRGGNLTSIPDQQRGWNTLTKWRNFWNTNKIGEFLYGWMDSLFPTDESELLNSPKTVDQYQQEDFIWQRSPWLEGHHWGSEENREDSGISYLLVYYMGMYYHIWEEYQ